MAMILLTPAKQIRAARFDEQVEGGKEAHQCKARRVQAGVVTHQ
jgi:hypothetical protein